MKKPSNTKAAPRKKKPAGRAQAAKKKVPGNLRARLETMMRTDPKAIAQEISLLTLALYLNRADDTAALILRNLAIESADRAGMTGADIDATRGKSPGLKWGYTADFCGGWLSFTAREMAGQLGSTTAVPVPPVNDLVNRAMALLEEQGPAWLDNVSGHFRPMRGNWDSMLTWEKKQLVRSTFKTAARTLKRQAEKLGLKAKN